METRISSSSMDNANKIKTSVMLLLLYGICIFPAWDGNLSVLLGLFATAKFLDVHLMIVSPEKYVARFAEAGADLVTFHLEATDDPAGCVALIRRAGAKAGVSIKPATPVEALREVLPLVDLVLVMSVEPGFGGQSFIPGSLEKIAQLRAMAREMGLETIIEVDGGISARNAGAVYGAGADVLVAGSSVFGAEDPQAEVVKMLNA